MFVTKWLVTNLVTLRLRILSISLDGTEHCAKDTFTFLWGIYVSEHIFEDVDNIHCKCGRKITNKIAVKPKFNTKTVFSKH